MLGNILKVLCWEIFALKDGIATLVLEWPRVRESLPDNGRKATTTATLAIYWTIYFAVTTTASGQTLAGPRLPLRSISWYAAWVPFPKWIWSVTVFVHLARRIRDKHSRDSCCLNQKIDQVHTKLIHLCIIKFFISNLFNYFYFIDYFKSHVNDTVLCEGVNI